MPPSIPEAIEAIKRNDRDVIKNLISLSREDQSYREELSGSEAIWNSLNYSNDLELLLLNNLCVSQNAAVSAVATKALSRLLPNLEAGDSRQQRLSWQILANLANHTNNISYFDNLALFSCLNEALKESDTRLPSLQMALTLVVKFKHEAVRMLAQNDIFDRLLNLETEWFEANAKELTSRLLHLFEVIIQNGDAVFVYENLRDPLLHPILFRIYDAVCEDIDVLPEYFVAWLVPLLIDTMNRVSDHIERNTRKEGLRDWENLIEMLRVAGHKGVVGSYSELARPLLPSTVKLLNLSKALPRRNKLRSEGNLNPEDYPFLRTELIPLLSLLVQKQDNLSKTSRLQAADFDAQEYVRENGGLVTVLESCVIDENNPYMKERAIVCLRVLLDHNTANQDFVAKLEAKRVEDPEALAKAGYEATIEDGKIRLKNAHN